MAGFGSALPPDPARTAHRDPRRLQIRARRLAAYARLLLDPPQPKRRAVRSICVLASAPATRWRQRPRTLPPRPVAAAGVAPGSGSATHDELCGDAGRRCIADRPPARELDSRPNGRRTPDRAAGGGAARCTSRRPPQHGGFLRQQQCARRERAGRKCPTARRRVRCCQDQEISRWLTARASAARARATRAPPKPLSRMPDTTEDRKAEPGSRQLQALVGQRPF